MRSAVVVLTMVGLAACESQPIRTVPPSLEVVPSWYYSSKPDARARQQRAGPSRGYTRSPERVEPLPARETESGRYSLPPEIRFWTEEVSARLRELQQHMIEPYDALPVGER